MVKYILEWRGFGKMKHKSPKEISEKSAEKYESEGKIKVYSTKEEAKKEC